MDKRTFYVLLLSGIVIVAWIGYTVYSNIYVATYTGPDVTPYLPPVDTNMYTDALNKVNQLSGNIKISNASLQPPTPTPTPSPSATPTPSISPTVNQVTGP
jgi:hypothetical protein